MSPVSKNVYSQNIAKETKTIVVGGITATHVLMN
jgi:hypothetical protein